MPKFIKMFIPDICHKELQSIAKRNRTVSADVITLLHNNRIKLKREMASDVAA